MAPRPHLLAVDCKHLEHRVVPHHPWPAAAVEYLVLGREKIVRRVLPADLDHGKVRQGVEAKRASSMTAPDSTIDASKSAARFPGRGVSSAEVDV